MATEDDDLQEVTPEDLLLAPAFSLAEEIAEAPSAEPLSGGDALSKFDRRYRDPFTGMLFIGYLENTFDLLGHTFHIKTPTQRERLKTGLIHKQYLNSISSELAWAAITVALYLQSVDGTPLPEPIGPADTGLQDRFNWVLDNLKGVVIQRVFEKVMLLDAEVGQVIEELERLGEL